MPTKEPSKYDILRGALGPSAECPPLEKLIHAETEHASSASAELAGHLESCAYCQAELHLWKTFETATDTQASEDVRKVTVRLDERMLGTLKRPDLLKAQLRLWSQVFTIRWLAPASLAMACLLLVVGAVVKYKQAGSPPALDGTNQFGQEVLRSTSLTAVTPSGDVRERPNEIRWESMPGAAKYDVRLLEVDRTEIWKAETSGDRVELPSTVRSRIVPAKTLFYEVTAFDSSGSKVGETGLVRFRLLQNEKNH